MVARGAGLLPAPLLDRARLAEARRLETRVRRSPAIRGAALVFHAVGPSGGDGRWEIDPPLAAERLDAIVGYLADRYQLVRASELPEAACTRQPGQPPPVAVTFDDDLPSHHEFAAPILERHGAVATVFLCGSITPFWWHRLQVAVDSHALDVSTLAPLPSALVGPALERQPGAIRRLAIAIENLPPAQRDEVAARLERAVSAPSPLLSAQARADLARAGWEIGFHTHRHDLLTALDDDTLRKALERGRESVAEGPIRTVAYPHGKAGEREARAARQAGYVAAYTTRGEVFTEETNIHLIGRLCPDTVSVGRFGLGLARRLARVA
jgi:peptidoglycan/xylan/chitin deacetylase (PgdA/CDA1 family)